MAGKIITCRAVPTAPIVPRMSLRAMLPSFIVALASLIGCGSTPPRPAAVDPRPEMPVPALPSPPETSRNVVTDTVQGVELSDPYRWLEDGDAAPVKAWVDSQDAYTRTLIDSVKGRDALERRFTELFYVDAVSAPWHRGSRWFFTRRHKDKEKAVVYWRSSSDAVGAADQDHVLLDPNTWSQDGSTALGGWYPSHDGNLVAYNLKANNADEATMHVLDVATGKDLSDVIPGTKYSGAAWTPDAKGFYYVFLPSGPNIAVDQRPGYAEIRYHALGTDPAKDPQVFPATGSAESFIGVDLSEDGHWLFVSVQYGWNATDVWFKRVGPKHPTLHAPVDIGVPHDATPAQRVATFASALGFTPLFVGRGALAEVTAYKDRFYVKTNDGAPRFRVMGVDPKAPAIAKWKELIPEGAGTLDALQVAGGHLVASTLVDASSRLEVHDLDGKLLRAVALPGIGSVSGLVGNPDDDEAFYSFTSFTTPTEIYKTSIAKGDTTLWAKVELPVDTSQVVVDQVFYPSKDGTKVSMFIVHKQGIAKDGSHPTLLYGYGGFNQNMLPGFASSVVVWLEMGGVYAVPNLRGGGEYGEEWHKDGMLAKKQNVFDDFIAAGEYLVKEGWTTSERLAIRGGSNGGLLVGAAMTQRPDLFKAVVCTVPLLDMVRYHLFGSGRTWIPEYGSAEDPAMFPVLYAYSPYHHIVKGTRYPALLMVGADSDDRVDPMHARKFTAMVQWAVSEVPDAQPALFRVERHAGHGGADMVKQTVETYADQWAFLAWQLGVDIHVGGAP
ncbi:MAG: prolyl oligopeptidase family serine peptidase [Myxococcota bacterium]